MTKTDYGWRMVVGQTTLMVLSAITLMLLDEPQYRMKDGITALSIIMSTIAFIAIFVFVTSGITAAVVAGFLLGED